MKLVAGLGNPGDKYKFNRHNTGRLVVDRLRESKFKIYNWEAAHGAFICKGSGVILARANDTFMNESGEWISNIKDYYKIEKRDIIVVYDDLDLEMGQVKVTERGPRVHNGVNSIIYRIGDGFTHVRCGVDDRAGDRSMAGSDYVLRDFPNEQLREKLISLAEAEVFKLIEVI